MLNPRLPAPGRVCDGRMEYGYFISVHIVGICVPKGVGDHSSSQFSEMGEESDSSEGCSTSFSRGSLLKRLRQMLMASQCRFLSLTRDSLIQLRASVSRKLRKMSRRVSLEMIFLMRLLLYFLRSRRVLQVRMASRMSLRSKMLTFSDLRKETKALQKFLEMFLVLRSWSSSPSLLSLLLRIFLKMQTFFPSALSLVSFLSLSLVETASLGSRGNCSACEMIQFSGMRREQVSSMVYTLSLQTISVIFLMVFPFISQRWFLIFNLEEASSSRRERWKLFWYSQSMLFRWNFFSVRMDLVRMPSFPTIWNSFEEFICYQYRLYRNSHRMRERGGGEEGDQEEGYGSVVRLTRLVLMQWMISFLVNLLKLPLKRARLFCSFRLFRNCRESLDLLLGMSVRLWELSIFSRSMPEVLRSSCRDWLQTFLLGEKQKGMGRCGLYLLREVSLGCGYFLSRVVSAILENLYCCFTSVVCGMFFPGVLPSCTLFSKVHFYPPPALFQFSRCFLSLLVQVERETFPVGMGMAMGRGRMRWECCGCLWRVGVVLERKILSRNSRSASLVSIVFYSENYIYNIMQGKEGWQISIVDRISAM